MAKETAEKFRLEAQERKTKRVAYMAKVGKEPELDGAPLQLPEFMSVLAVRIQETQEVEVEVACGKRSKGRGRPSTSGPSSKVCLGAPAIGDHEIEAVIGIEPRPAGP